jgi:glycosyltransferase involved in cell wall biosynthesis
VIDVILNWQASTLHAWGIVGLNIFLHLSKEADIRPLMGHMMQDGYFPMLDPIRMSRFQLAAQTSNQHLQALLAGSEHQRRSLRAVLINSLGNTMLSSNDKFSSKREIGRLVFETERLEDARDRLARYDCILCASNWNAEVVRRHSDKPVCLIFEGIDPSLFHPAPRSGLMNASKFYVFSGGKLEFRKGQDIVVKAFRQFAARHSDAVLVTSWRSPWPQHSAGFQGILEAPLRLDANGQIAVTQWCVENGIPQDQVLDVGLIPNPMMPTVVREMDCTISASRCEGGTSLPSMESMACGVPLIIANNTGLSDLIDGDNCIAIRDQKTVSNASSDACTDGWGESNADEIVEALEKLYADSQLRKAIGNQGARWILDNERTWSHHTTQLEELVKGVLHGGALANIGAQSTPTKTEYPRVIEEFHNNVLSRDLS